MHKLKLYRLCPTQWTTKGFKTAAISHVFRNANQKTKLHAMKILNNKLACSSHNWGSTNNSVAVCTDNISTVGLNSDLKYAEEDILLCVASWRLKVLETMWVCCNVQPAYASKEALGTSMPHWKQSLHWVLQKVLVLWGFVRNIKKLRKLTCVAVLNKNESSHHIKITWPGRWKVSKLLWHKQTLFRATASLSGLCCLSSGLLSSPDHQCSYLCF